jgi:RNA polymerase sigma-70 factor (ECF subfamily)
MNQQPENQPISIDALKSGDRSAFASFVDQYSEQIFRIALKFTGDSNDAEDVLQETFIKAMRALPSFEGRSSLSTWLYRIAVNEALMVLRKRKPEMVSVEENDPDSDDNPNGLVLKDWCCLPEDELLSSESKLYLQNAVDRLPLTLRSVFLLRDIQGISIRETAETLGLTETTVKTRLLRARLKLRETLSVYYSERLEERSTHV